MATEWTVDSGQWIVGSGHHSKCKNVLGKVSLAFFFDKTVTKSYVWAQNMFCHISEEQRLTVFQNRMLRKIFGSKREEAAGDSKKYTLRNLTICTPQQILFK